MVQAKSSELRILSPITLLQSTYSSVFTRVDPAIMLD